MDEFVQRELDKKYRNTHAGIVNRLDKNDVHAGLINGIEGGVISAVVDLNGKWTRKNFALNEYRLIPPLKSRLFNWRGHTYKYHHRPERQWQVGLCENNAQVVCLEEGVLHIREQVVRDVQMRGLPSPWRGTQGSPFVDLFIPNNAKTIGEAITHINKSGDSSKVVRKAWSVMATEGDVYALWFYDYLVGKINNNKRTIKILNNLFKQEINDLLYRTGEFYECIEE